MGNDAYEASRILEVNQGIHGAVQRFGVKGAETFIDEHGIEPYSSLPGLDHVGKTQCQ